MFSRRLVARDLDQLESSYAECDGYRVHVRVPRLRPQAGAPVIVLVHGVGVSSRYLAPLAERLSRQCHVLIPDLPGFGRTKSDRILGVRELGSFLARWLDHENLTGVHLFGNSMGCQVIVELLLHRPDLVRSAVLQGPTVDAKRRRWHQQLFYWISAGAVEAPSLNAVLLRDYLDAGFRRLITTFNDAMAHPIEDRLAPIQTPVLVVRGERDPIATPEFAAMIAERLSCGQLVTIQRGGHALNYSYPDELSSVVLPFIESHGETEPRPCLEISHGSGAPVRDRWRSKPVKPASSVASFDSATAMLRTLGRLLDGKPAPMTGLFSDAGTRLLRPAARVLETLPDSWRRQVYIASGWAEAINPKRLGGVDAGAIAEYMVDHYPRRRYPAIVLGSASGSLVHLWGALQIPWLPQTYLLPVRRSGVHPDEPQDDLAWGVRHAEELLHNNPELALHHMNDAVQDRLMIQRMTYFRVKRRSLGQAYREFIDQCLEPGGTLFIARCDLKWPVTRIGRRHVFQHGALGGAKPEEFHRGGPRVQGYLMQEGSHRRHWDSPVANDECPEAEWGFDPSWLDEIHELARSKGYRIRTVHFDDPELPSPFVADLYRQWYARLQRPTRRLLIESFILHDPYWALRTASVPFWMTFNTEPSPERVEQYLETVQPFDEIFLFLFSHGVDSIGLVPVERWQKLVARAKVDGQMVAFDPRRYPRHFATLVRYYHDFQHATRARFDLPGPMPLNELEGFIEKFGDRYAIRWT